MTTPAQTTGTEWPPPVSVDPPLPFPNAATFPVTHPIELEQLTAEISKAASRTVTLALSGPTNGNEAISDANPATLAVTPGSVDRAAVEQAIAAHSPVPGFAVPDAEKRFSEALQKIVDDENATLTADEIQAALRGLLVRSMSPFRR